jgi:flagellar basal body rod protein FlgG
MNSTSSIALSGLRSAQLRMDTSAHNIANAQTAGFRRQQITQQTQANGGITSEPTQSETPLQYPEEALADDLVQQKMAAVSFLANLKVLVTHERMQGTLLDLRA